MNQQNENPFQAPADYSVAPVAALVDEPAKPISVARVLAKWATVCSISAAPSFLFGLMATNSQFSEIAGMVAGVCTFIVAYTAFECTPLAKTLIQKRLVRTTARIGYGARMLISVVFPLGAYIDIRAGILSVTITNKLFGKGVGEFDSQFASPIVSFFWFYSTTLIQGFFLNIVLLVFMIVVYGIGVLCSQRGKVSS